MINLTKGATMKATRRCRMSARPADQQALKAEGLPG
jgi:hypothetical protein